MPIEAQIPLDVKAVQMPDPVQSYGNALAMKSHVQQQQLQQQQMKENAMKLDQMTRDKADDETIKRLYLENKGDLDATAKAAAPLVGPAKSRQLQQLSIETQTKLATLGVEQNKLLEAKNNQFAGYLQGIISAPADQRQALWSNAKADAIAKGLMKPEEAPDQVPDDAGLQLQLAAHLGGAVASQRAHEALIAKSSQAQAAIHNLTLASQTVPDDPQQYSTWLSGLDPDTRAKVNAVAPAYSTEGVAAVRKMGLNPEQQAQAPKLAADTAEAQSKAEMTARQNAAGLLSASKDQAEYARNYIRPYINPGCLPIHQVPYTAPV